MNSSVRKMRGLKKNTTSPALNTGEIYRITNDLVSFLSIEINFIQNCLKYNSKHEISQPKRKNNELIWTSEKIKLVQLIYPLYLSGYINNGKANIKDIKEAFEEMLSVDLSDCYRYYMDIKRRTSDKCDFLNELSVLLEKDINESLNNRHRTRKKVRK